MLDPKELTHSSRIMLVVYPVFSLYIGLSYLLGDPMRTATPSFDTARALAPLWVYSFLFFLEFILQAVAWVTNSTMVMIIGLGVGFGVSLGWALHFAISVFRVEYASLTAPAIWLFIAICHIASLQSVTKDPVF